MVLASAAVFNVIKLVGATYLIYLGAMALRDAWQGVQVANKLDIIAQPAVVSGCRALAEGWLTGILNPKPSMFYLAVFPQFLDPTGPMFLEGLSLGALHASIALVWYGFVVFTVEQVRSYLRHDAVARTIKAVSGAVLVGLGARLATLRAPA